MEGPKGRKAYRPKQQGQRPDTRYVVFPPEILEHALGEVEAHTRENAAAEFGDGAIAIPARSVTPA